CRLIRSTNTQSRLRAADRGVDADGYPETITAAPCSTRSTKIENTPRMSDTTPQSSVVDAINTALQALRAGRMVIVVDARERENEGDLICAAESITPEMIDFMLRQGAGVLCAPLTADAADRLRLSPIVDHESNTSPHQTPFLMPVDHQGAGTGVSAEARTLTIRA